MFCTSKVGVAKLFVGGADPPLPLTSAASNSTLIGTTLTCPPLGPAPTMAGDLWVTSLLVSFLGRPIGRRSPTIPLPLPRPLPRPLPCPLPRPGVVGGAGWMLPSGICMATGW